MVRIKDAATRHNIIATHHLQTFLDVLCVHGYDVSGTSTSGTGD